MMTPEQYDTTAMRAIIAWFVVCVGFLFVAFDVKLLGIILILVGGIKCISRTIELVKAWRQVRTERK